VRSGITAGGYRRPPEPRGPGLRLGALTDPDLIAGRVPEFALPRAVRHVHRLLEHLGGIRQWIESVNDTVKDQLDLAPGAGCVSRPGLSCGIAVACRRRCDRILDLFGVGP
jgi:hypothetical protein